MAPTTVINLFAGPGAGKSTTAAGLFFLMKSLGFKVELVTEYAKELAYANLLDGTAGTQYKIFREQALRQRRLVGAVDYIITDSPLLMQFMYADKIVGMRDAYPEYLTELKEEMGIAHNIDYLIERCKPYAPYGRIQTADEAAALDRDIRRLLLRAEIDPTVIKGDWRAPFEIFRGLFGTVPEQFSSAIQGAGYQACSIHDPECEACQ